MATPGILRALNHNRIRLYEFMVERRAEILAACRVELGNAAESVTQLELFFDALLRSLGPTELEEARAPDVANLRQLPPVALALARVLGQLREKYGVICSEDQYQKLNRHLAAGLATSIEDFWREDRNRENRLATARFFCFMTQEVRNAMSNTSLAFKLLRTGSSQVPAQSVEVVARHLLRMEASVWQCLGLVQLELGIAPTLAAVHVASVVRGLEAASSSERNVQIHLELDERLFIAADEMLLAAALGHLLRLASDASVPDSTIGLRAAAKDGAALLEIYDGCSAPSHGHAEQWSQGPALKSVKRALEAMRGELDIRAEPGQGCTFRARFPLSKR